VYYTINDGKTEYCKEFSSTVYRDKFAGYSQKTYTTVDEFLTDLAKTETRDYGLFTVTVKTDVTTK